MIPFLSNSARMRQRGLRSFSLSRPLAKQIAIGMSGEGFEQLARAILMVLDQNPELREWRSANSFLPLQGGGLRWRSSSYPESIISRWDHVRRPRTIAGCRDPGRSQDL